MDCVLSGSLLVVFSLFCYAMCVFLEQINSLSLSDVSLIQTDRQLMVIIRLQRAPDVRCKCDPAKTRTAAPGGGGRLARQCIYVRLINARSLSARPAHCTGSAVLPSGGRFINALATLITRRVRKVRRSGAVAIKPALPRPVPPVMYPQGEVTSQNLWSRYDRHFVGITRHIMWS